MRIKAFLVVVAMLASTLVVSWQQAPRAVACSCVALTPTEQADMAGVVARGTVVAVERPARPTSSLEDATYTVELTEAWKGDPPARVTILTAVDGASCGWEGIDAGMEIIVFAQPDGGAWRSNLCDGSAPADERVAAELTAYLGAPTAIAPTAGPTGGSGLSDPRLAGVVMLTLVASGLAAWLVTRRR